MGRKFKRQKPMGRYVVDFICLEEMLVIELDGGQHVENFVYDQKRDSRLRSQGFTVLRFWNNEMMNELENVLEKIRLAIARKAVFPTTLSPDSSPLNGRGDEQ